MKKTKQAPQTLSPRKRLPSGVIRRSRSLSQEEIDERVIAQAEDDAAWKQAIHVSRKPTAIGLSATLAHRAAFLARLHRERNLESWVQRVVRERVELEEKAFTQARRDLTSKTGA